jgi:hypothetical protein
MSVVLVGDHFIKCDILVEKVEIINTSIILRIRYVGRVWTLFCYRSIPHLTVDCFHADRVVRLQLERDMIRCLTILKSGLCMPVESLQKTIIKLCRVYFTRKQISCAKTTWR